MTQITITTIISKIASIVTECKIGPRLEIPQGQVGQIHLKNSLETLELIRLEFIKYRNIEEQYVKLENLLQKQQTEIRKKIGIEQQFKLYTETLKTQVQELQAEKVDLLENSKSYIKQLKKTNELLFAQLHARTHFHKIRQKSKSNSPFKAQPAKHNKSVSHAKPKHDKSIKEIIKTQYIERDRSTSGHKKKNRKNAKFGVYSTISGHEGEYRENAKTFQVVGSGSVKKSKYTTSKKKNKHGFSNFALLNLLDSSNRKLKKEQKCGLQGKSPGKKGNKKDNSRIKAASKALWRDKKANKSNFSVMSVDGNLYSKKQTI